MTTTTGRGLAVTSPKLIFTEDGKACYGYSGIITVQSAALPLFESVTSPTDPLLCKIGVFTPLSSSNNAEITISLSGVTVVSFEVLNTTQGDYLTGFSPIEIILPPNTEFKMTAINVASSAEMQWCATLVGRAI